MSRRNRKIEYLRDINAYLHELELISGSKVIKDDLSSLGEVEQLRKKSTHTTYIQTDSYVILFTEKKSQKYILRLERFFGSDKFLVWTSKTNYCGIFYLEGINCVDFSFPFDINDEGIVVFLNKDVQKKVISDFSTTASGEQVLEIELLYSNIIALPQTGTVADFKFK